MQMDRNKSSSSFLESHHHWGEHLGNPNCGVALWSVWFWVSELWFLRLVKNRKLEDGPERFPPLFTSVACLIHRETQ